MLNIWRFIRNLRSSRKKRALFCFIVAFGAVASPVLANGQQDADALFAAEEWADAAMAYEALLQDDQENANNWFNLGQARHRLEDYRSAQDAYRNALDKGYAPPARARFHLARALMSLGETEAALKELEEIAATGGPNYRVIQNAAEFAPLTDEPRFQAVIEALKPCGGVEYRQFDFWLGDWDVTPASAPQTMYENNISSAQDGCVVFEQYTAGAFTGMSLNFYDARTEKWHQTWMSNAGGAIYLEGGLNADGAMQMTDEDLPISAVTGAINRVTWTPHPDGSVRQLWESSSDGGEIWTVVFDGLYVKKRTE